MPARPTAKKNGDRNTVHVEFVNIYIVSYSFYCEVKVMYNNSTS